MVEFGGVPDINLLNLLARTYKQELKVVAWGASSNQISIIAKLIVPFLDTTEINLPQRNKKTILMLLISDGLTEIDDTLIPYANLNLQDNQEQHYSTQLKKSILIW